MPLLNCPDCNKEVSDKAVSCINCGCPITSMDQNQAPEHVVVTFPEQKGIIGATHRAANFAMKAILWGCVIFVLLVFVGCVALMYL